MLLRKILDYLNPLALFRKSGEKNVNLRMMHGINRLSFFMFLICLAIMAAKFLF